ncbi:PIG-L family deacetylase [Microlunatus sp. GCM10028923]|uniref:PIG-L family deacetylase n=1 Tax=Microlunatus sp. GCM10028923 TaxID=3273400 RepID=UPI00361DBB63
MDIPVDVVPSVKFLLVVSARPDDMVFALGGMIRAFADAGSVVQVVSLSDGQRLGATPGHWIGLSHRIVEAADDLGVGEFEILDHGLAELPVTPVSTLAREVWETVGRADAVLAIDAAGRVRPTQVVAFRTAQRVAKLLDAPLLRWSGTAPRRRPADAGTITVEVPRARHRAAFARLVGAASADRSWVGTAPEPWEYLTVPVPVGAVAPASVIKAR